MNVLPFVLTMIVVVTIMTYQRLESFVGAFRLQQEYRMQMKKTELGRLNSAQNGIYDRFHCSKPAASTQSEEGSLDSDEEDSSPDREVLRSKIGLSSLFELDQKGSESTQQRYDLIKKLIAITYQDQPFFIEVQQQIPDVVDRLLTLLIDRLGFSESKARVVTAKQLASVDLGDGQLQEVWYKMLKGTRDTKDDSNKGYPSLLNFLSMQRSSKSISIYLAPKEILLAIYEDSHLVEEILKFRFQLYRQVRNGKINKEEASLQFKEAFAIRVAAELASLLDFRVSKTKPVYLR